jgi:hypothetical protein
MCLNEGWTIRPPSPVLPDDDNDVFTPEPLDPAMIADGKVCVYLYIVVVKLWQKYRKRLLDMIQDGSYDHSHTILS